MRLFHTRRALLSATVLTLALAAGCGGCGGDGATTAPPPEETTPDPLIFEDSARATPEAIVERILDRYEKIHALATRGENQYDGDVDAMCITLDRARGLQDANRKDAHLLRNIVDEDPANLLGMVDVQQAKNDLALRRLLAGVEC